MNRLKYKPRWKRILVGLLFMLAASGCTKRVIENPPVEPDKGTLALSLRWDAEAPCAGARIYLYDQNGGLCKSTECPGTDLTLEMPEGTYRLIVHNTDATGVGYTGMDRHATAETHALGLSGQIPSQGEALTEPRNAYGIGKHDQGEIFTIGKGQTTALTATPVRLTRDITFYFSVTGLGRVSQLSGTLQGVAPSVSLCTGVCRSTACTQPFTAQAHTKAAGTLQFAATMAVFGLVTQPGSPAETNSLETVITAGDGKVYSVKTDITGALQEIIADNAGSLPVDIPLDVEVEVNPVSAQVGAVVKPWDNGGTGGGEPRPR